MSDNDDIEVESDADKRAHHNALERKRRDHIKDSFHSLRDSVPSLQGEKASRAQILDKATEYIQYMRRKNHTHQQDIDDLKRQNALLEQQEVLTACYLQGQDKAQLLSPCYPFSSALKEVWRDDIGQRSYRGGTVCTSGGTEREGKVLSFKEEPQ
uniref:Protein max n=1 Tax=Equus caballus TaxID=9796 RepID=A0A3Q2HSX0_HORSE